MPDTPTLDLTLLLDPERATAAAGHPNADLVDYAAQFIEATSILSVLVGIDIDVVEGTHDDPPADAPTHTPVPGSDQTLEDLAYYAIQNCIRLDPESGKWDLDPPCVTLLSAWLADKVRIVRGFAAG